MVGLSCLFVSALILVGSEARAQPLPEELPAIDTAALKFRKQPASVEPAGAPQRTRPASTPLPLTPVLSGDVDMAPFLERLESATLDTTKLRQLLKLVSVSFADPGGNANALYSSRKQTVFIRTTLKDPAKNAVSKDLDSANINTLIHELMHAAADRLNKTTSPGKEHHEALAQIEAQVRGWNSSAKANELASYYMGCAIANVLDAVDEVRVYNTNSVGRKVASAAEARSLGDRLLDFSERPAGASSEDKPTPGMAEMWATGLGNSCDVAQVAELEGAVIGVEPDLGAKGTLYREALGLKPPLTVKELVQRMNAPEHRFNPIIKKLQAETRAARAAWAAERAAR